MRGGCGWFGGVPLGIEHHLEALIVGHVVRRECHQETEQGKKYVKNKVLRFMYSINCNKALF